MRGRPPNVFWFIADDTAHAMLGCYGGAVLSPNIDAMAREGALFTNFHCVSAACTPSRYNYLTGRYASRCAAERFQPLSGEPCNIWFNTDLEPDRESCIARVFQDAGYRTGFVGKWHVGGGSADRAAMPKLDPDADPYDPVVNRQMQAHQEWLCGLIRRAGFEYAASAVYGNHEGIPRRARQHNLEWTVQGALDFLEQTGRDGRPFFLHMAVTAIHGPDHLVSLGADPRITAGGIYDRHWGVLPERRTIPERLHAAGLPVHSTTVGVLWMDDAFGAVLRKIRDLGLEGDTIVVWSTDHGFSGGKFSVYEPGLRIPFLLRWKNHLPTGRRITTWAQTVDLFPTLLELAGVSVSDGLERDGRSLVPWLREGEAEGMDREELYSEFGYTRALRRGRWKYIAWRLPESLLAPLKRGESGTLLTHFGRPLDRVATHPNLMVPLILSKPHYFEPDQLYDLKTDPFERINRAADPECAAVLNEMRERLQQRLAGFPHPFPLFPLDPFYGSDRYRALCHAAREALRPLGAAYWRQSEAGGFDAILRQFYGLDAESQKNGLFTGPAP